MDGGYDCINSTKAFTASSLGGTTFVPNIHAVSRYMVSKRLVIAGAEEVSGGAMYGCNIGFLFMDSRNQGSTRKSPVCRTAPWSPSTRNL